MSDFTAAPVKPVVPFSALEALDIRVGTIERVEDIPRSEKLLKLTVNFGDHSRTILAGMKKERENPREIEGKQALFVLNLEPKKMAGEISQGMLFDLGYADGILPALATPERPVPNGTRAVLAATALCHRERRAVCAAKDLNHTRRRNSNLARPVLPPHRPQEIRPHPGTHGFPP